MKLTVVTATFNFLLRQGYGGQGIRSAGREKLVRCIESVAKGAMSGLRDLKRC